MMALQNPTPSYFNYHTQPTPSPSPFYSQPSTPTQSCQPSTSTSTSTTTIHKSSSLKCRPKLPHKKPSCSTRDKRTDVQQNLEAKVEKAKGFHAFFVPLGKSLPPAPPCSPVLGATNPQHGRGGQSQQDGMGKDYFEDWVEDVGRKIGAGRTNSNQNAMDLD